jgi:hypothetical protein
MTTTRPGGIEETETDGEDGGGDGGRVGGEDGRSCCEVQEREKQERKKKVNHLCPFFGFSIVLLLAVFLPDEVNEAQIAYRVEGYSRILSKKQENRLK